MAGSRWFYQIPSSLLSTEAYLTLSNQPMKILSYSFSLLLPFLLPYLEITHRFGIISSLVGLTYGLGSKRGHAFGTGNHDYLCCWTAFSTLAYAGLEREV